MKLRKKVLIVRLTLAFVVAVVAVVVLQNYPQPFFSTSVHARNLGLFSDKEFARDEGVRVLERVNSKLAASPLYLPMQNHVAFVCNQRWRQRMFFLYQYGAGGINWYPSTTNVFLRDAIIEENCLIGPKGGRVGGDRTLDYFITHEITHTLTGQAAGWYAYHFKLPQWVREGYADYVGKGASFNYDEAKRAFLEDAPQMNYQKSGLYWRFHLLVAHLLDKEGWTVDRLLREPIPQETVENAIRTGERLK